MSKTDIEKYSQKFVELISSLQPVVVLTGAGVSTASGIPDFRGPDGLYSKISPRVFELDFFLEQPQEYYSLTMNRIHMLKDVKPNETHILLAILQKHGFIETVITQNIDGLHQKAGMEGVIELHGNAGNFYCMDCGETYTVAEIAEKLKFEPVPYCSCGGLIRPDVVFLGEFLSESALARARESSQSCQLFVVMGSSLNVYPAAGFPRIAAENGAYLLIINRGETALDYMANLKFDCDLEAFSKAVLEKFKELD